MLSKKTISRRVVARYVPTVAVLMFSFVLFACTTSAPSPKPTLTTTTPPTTVAQSKKCGIQECHGMDLTCGSNPVEMCTEMYAPGDRCREFFTCTTSSGSCQAEPSIKFQQCTQCVNRCNSLYQADAIKLMECESACS